MANRLAGRSFLRTFGLVLLAIGALFVADMFLAQTERAESLVEAARFHLGHLRRRFHRLRSSLVANALTALAHRAHEE